MPSNPMQRKVRNSFLLGMVVMLLVALLIGGLLFMLIVRPILDDKKAEEAVTYATVFQLKQKAKAGNEINTSMLQKVTLPVTSLPSDKKIAEKVDQQTGKAKDVALGQVRAKVDLEAGTILSDSVLTEIEELDDSARLIEYNMITLPITVDIGDYIDIRITLPNGQDLIVVANKEIKDINGSTITMLLTEGEIIMMNSAIVEAYIMPSSNLYLTKYSEPGIQEAAVTTYTPTTEAMDLINSNPNITTVARNTFSERFSKNLRDNYINTQVGQYSEERILNIEAGVQKQIEAAKAAREDYLSGMSGY